MMKEKMVKAHMAVAEEYAKLSTAQRLKVGCIIVKDNRVISIGYNGTPAGWSNVCEDENDKTKPEVIHAEANAISKLARSNESGEGSVAFITHAPCMDCAKLLYGAGINYVYYRTQYRDENGINFLRSCGITVEQVKNGDQI